jgi:uncharacterized membrane protein
MRSSGQVVYDTTVLEIDAKKRARVYDPHRVVAGALTATLTWGLFGLVTGGVSSLVGSAVLGAIWGGAAAYFFAHHASKRQLARLAQQLPAPSSALLTFAETADGQTLLAAATPEAPTTASVALIADDLSARVLGNTERGPIEVSRSSAEQRLAPGHANRLTMILLRYPDPNSAANVTSRVAKQADASQSLEVELVGRTDHAGKRHVTDPKFGSAAIGRGNLASWGLLGLLCGALSGAAGSGGLAGLVSGGILTGVLWGLFGLGAGALYGLWAGRAISARRLKGIGQLLPPGTSTLLAWTDTTLSHDVASALTDSHASQHLALSFTPTGRGPILEVV